MHNNKNRFLGSLRHIEPQLVGISLMLLASNLIIWKGFAFTDLLGNPVDSRVMGAAALLSLVSVVGACFRVRRSMGYIIVFYLTVLVGLPIVGMYGVIMNQDLVVWYLIFVGGVCVMLMILDVLAVGVVFLLGSYIGYFICYVIQGGVILGEELMMAFYGGSALIAVIGAVGMRRVQIQEERLEDMSLLAGAIAHEMRTPLASIRMFCEGGGRLLKNDTPHDRERLEGVLRSIKEATGEALGTIDRLLVQSKGMVREGKRESEYMSYCVVQVLEDFPYVNDERERVNYEVYKDFMFSGGSGEVRLVLNNLVKNAVEQMRERGSGEVCVTIGEQGKSVVKVKDTGGGIRKEAMPYIFDAYFTTKSYGTGLGLGYCKIVMERLGGRIECRSVEGQGAEFLLYFPNYTGEES